MARSRNADQDTPETSAKWVAVKEWSGGFSTERIRESFERPQGTWRLSYKTESGEPGKNGVVDIIVRTKDNQMVAAAYNLQGAASGILRVKSEQPEYFVEISSFGPRWWIAVERSE
jgi:hypothetical protein